jgi:hypothetical protein
VADNTAPLVDELQELYVALAAVGYPWVAYCPTIYKAVQTIERLRAAIVEMSSIASEANDYMNDPSGSGLLAAIRDVALVCTDTSAGDT